MTDIVLIHGTTQAPSGWDRLIRVLNGEGHRCIAVDLLSHDDYTAADYAHDVATQLPPDLTDPAVVAHSGSGVLLPAVARRLRARRQIWLAAYIPDGRRSLIEEITAAPTEMFNPEWIGADPTADLVLATYFLFHDCDLATLKGALDTLRVFTPTGLYQDPVEPAPDIPSTYILATADRTLRPEWCRREAVRRLGAEALEINAGHCPHVSRPKETAALINRALSTH